MFSRLRVLLRLGERLVLMSDTVELDFPEVRAALVMKYNAEAAKESALARTHTASAEMAELQLERTKRQRDFALAEDSEHQIYRLSGVIDEDSVMAAREHFTRWSRMHPSKDLHLVINSTGGSVWDGMELFDEILALRAKGHRVIITVRGMAASMASILLQAGDERRMGREAYLLIHEPSGLAGGSIGEIEDAEAMLKLINERILAIYAERCAGSDADSPFSKETLRRRYRRRDWTLNSAEALAGGLVDEIA